jgi:uncharacterized metal-binding protein
MPAVLTLMLGLVICSGAFAASRAGALKVLRIGGLRRPMSWEAGEDYFRASRPRRALFRIAGPAGTYLLAALLALVGLRLAGERVATTRVHVTWGGPASVAGMRSGDRIVAIDGTPMGTWQQVKDTISAAAPGKALQILVDHAGQEEQEGQEGKERLLSVTPDAEGLIRVAPQWEVIAAPFSRSLLQAAARPVTAVAQALAAMTAELRSLSEQRTVDLVGPTAIIADATGPGARADTASRRWGGLILTLLVTPASIAWPISLVLELMLTPRRVRRRAEPSPPERAG